MNPTTPKPTPKAPVPKPPVGVKSPPGKLQHDAPGMGVFNWATDTARQIALTASQVLRKLDHSGLSIEDTAPPRGKSSGRSNPMPGGGMNPYESQPMPQSRYARKSSTVIKGAGAAPPVRGPAGARATLRASAPARSSWWQRLFRRG
jgi:hypothetical protein